MTLPELINYFSTGGSYDEFSKMQRLDSDAEAVEIYMPKPFGLNSKLEFFKTEETGGKTEYYYNGSEFYSFFNFYYFLNAIKEAQRNQNQSMTDIDIALRLLDNVEKNG
jgi:hypothetical protein